MASCAGSTPLTTPASLSEHRLAAEPLEHERFEVRAPDSGREHVLGEADVEELRGSVAAGLLEEAVEGLRVRDREPRARPLEGRPALADFRGGPFRDRDTRSRARGEQRLSVAGQQRHARPLALRDVEGLALLEAVRGEGRLRDLALDLGGEGMELELDEERFQFLGVRRRALQGLGVERDGQVGLDRREAAREERVFLVLAQALADLALDLVGPLEQPVEAAVLLDPLLGRDLAHARHAGDVVGRVAHERQDVDHLAGRDAEELLDPLVVEELLLARVEDAHAGALDQLQHVLVGRDDDDVEARRPRRMGERADHVVGLVAGHLEDRDPVGLARSADLGDLGGQVLVHGGPVRLVAVVLLVADGLLRPVEGDRQVLARMLAEHLLQHRHEAVDGVGRPAGLGREAPDRVVSAVDVGHRVHEVDGRARRGHGAGFYGAGKRGGREVQNHRLARVPAILPNSRRAGSVGSRRGNRNSLNRLRPNRWGVKNKSRDPFPESRDSIYVVYEIAPNLSREIDEVPRAWHGTR